MNEQNQGLDLLHHTAVVVENVHDAVNWYRERFRCEVAYEDSTWAMLRFRNSHLALVVADQHPPHVAFVVEGAEEKYGPLKPHRDGTRSAYIRDAAGNCVEVFSPEGLENSS